MLMASVDVYLFKMVTSPAHIGFNKLMVKTATARELSGSAWRPRRMPKSKMSCIMPLRTTEAESPETNIKSSVNTAETSAAGRRFSPSRPRKPRVNCVKIAMCTPDMAKMCEGLFVGGDKLGFHIVPQAEQHGGKHRAFGFGVVFQNQIVKMRADLVYII